MDGDKHKQERAPKGALLVPALTATFLGPGAVAIVRGVLLRRSLDLPVGLLMIPIVLAVLAAPGYLFAIFTQQKWEESRGGTKAWVSASLAVAAFAAASATVASIPTGFGPVLSLWSLVLVLRLAARYSRRTSPRIAR
jgi:hypothetical protein